MQVITAHENYLHDRGITEQVAAEVGLHWSEGKLVIPVKDRDGNFLFNKYRRSPDHSIGPKYMYDKGARSALFGAETVTPDIKTVYICEGELDSLVIRSQIRDKEITAVSSTGGAGTWDSSWNDLLDGKRVVIIYDTDKAGIVGSLHAAQKISGSKIAFLPSEKHKDVTEYYQAIQKTGYALTFPALIKTLQTHIIVLPYVFYKKDKSTLQNEWLQKIKNSKNTIYWEKIILEYINSIEPSFKPGKKKKLQPMEKNNGDLMAAKQRPCTDLLPFVQNKAKCLWHEEKDASLTYYPETNTCFCFGCRQRADAIDIYQKLHDCSLPAAIKALTSYA